MNELDGIIETSEAKTNAPVKSASRASYIGLVVLVAIFAFVFWQRARR